MNKLDEALNNPIEKARNSDGILNKIFWLMIDQYKIRQVHWRRSLKKYVYNPYNVEEQTPTRRTEAKSNLISALTSNETTWMQWLRGLRSQDIRKIRISIDFYRGEDMVHKNVSLDVDLTYGNENSNGDIDGEADD